MGNNCCSYNERERTEVHQKFQREANEVQCYEEQQNHQNQGAVLQNNDELSLRDCSKNESPIFGKQTVTSNFPDEAETQIGGSRYTSPSPVRGIGVRFSDSNSPYRASGSLSANDNRQMNILMVEGGNEQLGKSVDTPAPYQTSNWYSQRRANQMKDQQQVKELQPGLDESPIISSARSGLKQRRITNEKKEISPVPLLSVEEYTGKGDGPGPELITPISMRTNITKSEAIMLARARQLIPFKKIQKAKRDEILFEGELMKYKPGLKISYIDRWAQITKNDFRYFKNSLSANFLLRRPLQTISFRNIAEAKKVKVNVREDQGIQKEHGKLYQFEIFMRYDSDFQTYQELNNSYAIPCQENASQHSRRDHSASNASPPPNSNRLHRPSSSASPIRLRQLQNSRSVLTLLREGNDSGEFNGLARRSLYSGQPSRSPSPDLRASKKMKRVKRDHLMPSPSRVRSPTTTRISRTLSPISRSSPGSRSGTPTLSQSKPLALTNTLGFTIPFSENLAGHSYLEAPSSHLGGVSQFKPEEEINVKSPSAWINSTSSPATWTNREIEWYYAEKRYLFATKTAHERDQWLAALTALTEYHCMRKQKGK